MVSALNNGKNIFRPLFCYFEQNLVNLRTPSFPARGNFFGTSFVLFWP
jgi:hypothetical protein